jgi:hypothetical protein
LLIRLTLSVATDLDSDFAVEALQKIKQFVCRESAEMSIHQV